MTVTELLSRFVEHQAGRGRHPRTLEGYRRDLGRATRIWGAELDCQLLTYQHCLDFRALDQHLMPSTRSERMILLRQWLGWAHQQGFLWKNPALDLKTPCVRPVAAWVPSEEEVQRLLAAPDRTTLEGHRDAAVLELFYGTGLRRHELSSLNLIDWQSNPAGVWVNQGKGGKVRLQPVGDQAARILDEYLEKTRPLLVRNEQESALFLDGKGARYHYAQIPKHWAAYCHLAGLRRIMPHALRRAFATHMLLRGASLHEVQALLGHSNADVTQRYTKIGVLDLAREYNRCHPRARRVSGRPGALVRQNPRALQHLG